MIVRAESPSDRDAVRHINIEAFRDHPYSQQTEHLIVEALRAAEALEISLVAEAEGEIVGHVAFSWASVGEEPGWMLLGPIAVLPEHQGAGVGRALVEAGLAAVRASGARGCALVGDPAFYERFGFTHLPEVTCEGVPDFAVLCLPFSGERPAGALVHHDAFFVTGEQQHQPLQDTQGVEYRES